MDTGSKSPQQIVEELKIEKSKIKDKVDLLEQAQLLYSKAKEEDIALTAEIKKLENTLKKAKSLEEAEKNRKSSSPEVRRIWERIKDVLGEVHRLERQKNATRMAFSLSEIELENETNESEQANAGEKGKMKETNEKIAQLRTEVADLRKSNLASYLEKSEKLVFAEIDNQKLTTQVMLFKQLVASVQIELANLNSEKGKDIILKEWEKTDEAVKSCRAHDIYAGDEAPEEKRREMSACERRKDDIEKTEGEIVQSVKKMGLVEEEQDALVRKLNEACDTNAELARSISSADYSVKELTEKRDYLKCETYYKDEILKSTARIAELQKINDRDSAKIQELNDIAHSDDNDPWPAMENLQMITKNQLHKLDRMIEDLRLKLQDYE